MRVYWLGQNEADVPATNDWLSPGELHHLDTLRFLKRRMEWRLGRWTAKASFVAFREFAADIDALANIEIRPAPSGAPSVFIANDAADVTISISHRSGRAICAIAGAGVKLGCDLELVEPHSQAFIEDYLTYEEQLQVANASTEDRDRLVALFWSAKESVLKAMQVGLRVDTRCVTVQADEHQLVGRWTSLRAHSTAGHGFQGWWRQTEGYLQTLVGDPVPDRPIQLHVPALHQQTTIDSRRASGF